MSSKLTTKTLERLQRRGSGVFIVHCKQISRCYGAFINDFEKVNASWVFCLIGNSI